MLVDPVVGKKLSLPFWSAIRRCEALCSACDACAEGDHRLIHCNADLMGQEITAGDSKQHIRSLAAGEAKLCRQEGHEGRYLHQLLVDAETSERQKVTLPASQLLMYMVSACHNQYACLLKVQI